MDRPRSLGRLISSAILVVVAASCTSSSSNEGDAGAAGTGSSVAPSPSVEASSPSPLPECPNPEGEACLGELTPGQTYTTTLFTPGLSYSVPTEGWFNDEDTPGNFLLVPPGNDLAGVNAETSDFIGVDTSIAAERFTELRGCAAKLPDVPATPAGIARWIAAQPELQVTRPAPTEVGGLEGLVIDIRTEPGATLTTCVLDGQRFTLFLLFTGMPPSSLDHGVGAGMTMRLYLLRYQGGALAIEANDKDAAPGTLRSLTAVAEGLTFDV